MDIGEYSIRKQKIKKAKKSWEPISMHFIGISGT